MAKLIQGVDIQALLNQVRKDIKEKNLKEIPDEFSDVSLDFLNDNWEIPEWTEINDKNPVARFVKKVVRKSTFFIVNPMVTKQNLFNKTVIGCINRMNCRIQMLQIQLKEAQEQIEQLKKEQQHD